MHRWIAYFVLFRDHWNAKGSSIDSFDYFICSCYSWVSLENIYQKVNYYRIVLWNISDLAFYLHFSNNQTKDEFTQNFVTIYSIVPWGHTYGIITIINSIVLNKPIIYSSSFNIRTYLSVIQKYKVSFNWILSLAFFYNSAILCSSSQYFKKHFN